jgi:hypothetical protein
LKYDPKLINVNFAAGVFARRKPVKAPGERYEQIDISTAGCVARRRLLDRTAASG